MSDNLMVRKDYSPPALVVLGSFVELTQSGSSIGVKHDSCNASGTSCTFVNKTRP